MSESNYKTEYLLASDGKFYRRTTCTTFVQDQETAFSSVKAKPVFHVNRVPHYTLDNFVHFAEYVTPNNDDNRLFAFIKQDKFPLLGANLSEIPETNGKYRLNIQGIPYPELTTPREISGRNLETPLGWQPSVLGFDMYYMFTLRKRKYEYHNYGEPMIFLVNKSGEPFYPNLPNVYSDGRICCGENHPNSNDEGLDPVQFIKKQLSDSIYTSYCNSDLRASNEREWVQFDKDGNTIDTYSTRSTDSERSEKLFFIPATNENILNFATWLKQ